MTSFPPALAFSAFSQLLRKCPFKLDDIIPVTAPMFDNLINNGTTYTYCANLSHVPADIDNIYVSFIVGSQIPITVKAQNVALNGTIIELDSEYPRKQEVLEGMLTIAVHTAGYESQPDEIAKKSLGAVFEQKQQTIGGDAEQPHDKICPRAGGTLFWELIAP
jgi:hypothetical protein